MISKRQNRCYHFRKLSPFSKHYVLGYNKGPVSETRKSNYCAKLTLQNFIQPLSSDRTSEYLFFLFIKSTILCNEQYHYLLDHRAHGSDRVYIEVLL